MAENIASRVGRLISGTANMLVDTVENMAPEMVMEEAIREIDRAIDDIRAELGRLISKQHMATNRLAAENEKHTEISGKIEIALGEQREDLAEPAVSQLLDIEAQIPVLETTIAETRENAAELEGYIMALQGRKGEMMMELRQFRDSRKSIGDASLGESDGNNSGGGVESSVAKAEEAFERALEGSGGVAGSAHAPNAHDAAKRAELDELARSNRINERLAAFKAKEN